MTRTVSLSRADIRQALDRVTGAVTLKYIGKRLRFFDHLRGYSDGVFFAVVLGEVPLPETLVTLASAVGVSLDDHALSTELRRAVADYLASEALIDAPDYLGMCADPRASWLDVDMRELERRQLAAEARIGELSRLIESSLRARVRRHIELPPVRSTYEAMRPASLYDIVPLGGAHSDERTLRTLRHLLHERANALPAPEPEPESVVEEEIEVEERVETSEATAKRVKTAIKVAREQELSQRLPAGARRALARMPAGLFLSNGSALDRKADMCTAMMDAQESSKRAGEAVIIDWDGEWPVVARRYGAHGRIVYRVEDALRRQGIATEAA